MNHLQVAHGKDSQWNFSSLPVSVFKQWVPKSQPQTEPAFRQLQELGTPPWELAGCKPSSAPAYRPLSATLDYVEGSGFEWPLSIKPARYLSTTFLLPSSAAWASSCEIFKWYVSCSFSLSPFFFFFQLERLWFTWFIYLKEKLNLKQREMPGEKNYFLSRSIATIAAKL